MISNNEEEFQVRQNRGGEKLILLQRKRDVDIQPYFSEHDNFSENVLKYNSTFLMSMWTVIETLKANRVSLLVFLAQNKTLRVKV